MTGFIASVFLSRNRVSLKEAFEGLELCERKLSCTVLRGLDGSNPVRLLGYRPRLHEPTEQLLFVPSTTYNAHTHANGIQKFVESPIRAVGHIYFTRFH
jgi:hypothetical protein